jgi:hypothetical protein
MFKSSSLTIFFISLFFSTALFAQVKPSKAGKKVEQEKQEKQEPQEKSEPEEKVPPKKASKKGESKDVQVFDAKDDYDYFEKKKSNQSKNVIKINPLEILNGTFPIFYERVVAPKISIEAGLGVTATSSAYASFLQEFYENGNYDGFYKGKTGLMFKIGARYYAGKKDDAPEGAYLGVEYQVKQYVFDAYPYVKGNTYRASQGPYQETKITNKDMVRILFGYQSDNSNNFTWDYYVGIGWRNQVFDGWHLDDRSMPVLGSRLSSKPVFLIGLKMGVAF